MSITITNDTYFGGPKGRTVNEENLTPLQAAKLLKSLGVKARHLFYEQDDHMLWMATKKLDIAAVGCDGNIYSAKFRQSREEVASGYVRHDCCEHMDYGNPCCNCGI